MLELVELEALINNRRNNLKQPIIKWTGSKRFLADEIIEYFPSNIETYYEPFVGGGSVF
jgi:DNA adenine methylase